MSIHTPEIDALTDFIVRRAKSDRPKRIVMPKHIIEILHKEFDIAYGPQPWAPINLYGVEIVHD